MSEIMPNELIGPVQGGPTNHIGHIDGLIVFATSIPYWHTFVAPVGMETIEVDDATYAAASASVGKLDLMVLDGAAVPVPPRALDYEVWDWSMKAWVIPATALADAKARQSTLLDAACRAAIISGFESAALGSPHHYPAKITDQNNLVASVTASLYAGLPSDWTTHFWCEAGGEWSYATHTAAQIQQAGADGKAAILAHLTMNAGLQAQAAAASTIEAVRAVVW